MDNKEFRKISKRELLEVLLDQAKRIEKLEQELKQTKSKLESKKILIEDSGSLAEAALKLNGIFEAAQQSIDQYTLNVKEKCKKLESDTKKECQLIKEKAMKEIEELNKIKVKNNKDKKEIGTKIVVGKSKKVIKGRALKTIKKKGVS